MASDIEIQQAHDQYGMGAMPFWDPKSREYPIKAALPQGVSYPERSYTWSTPLLLNQGSTGTCVGHAFTHELAARPQSWPVKKVNVNGINYMALLVYLESCKRDPWTQNDGGDINFGTDTLSAVKVLTDMGFFGEYRWAFSLSELILATGYFGPAVLAVPWYNSMYFPNADGVITVDKSSGLSGWHAVLMSGQNVTSKLARIHNSWGNWGQSGQCFISFSDIEKLQAEGATAMVPLNRTYV